MLMSFATLCQYMPIIAAGILAHLPVCHQAEVSSGAFSQVDPISSVLDLDQVSSGHPGYTMCLKVCADHSHIMILSSASINLLSITCAIGSTWR